ncbi:hypothetical protein EVAR_49283_1 [Eumeta japonica]|uniref:Uncharacterized protein n=1 Tax=Eumeta variegata TaxID=151549 RepID=A0A4C1XQG9_EUMVA|nr:hypothetical protein EVAR_49283_1 [Eumeta japonica]
MGYECPESDQEKFFRMATPVASRATMHASSANSSRRKGNRPVTVSCDILCRGDSLQASSIVHVTRRRHPRVPSDRAR